jgi:hypothetical protein
VWNAYWQTVKTSGIDYLILGLGMTLIVAHLVGIIGRFKGRSFFFVQDLDRYRTFCLLVTELLPVLGLLGTVFGLMATFHSFELAGDGRAPDLGKMVQSFAPAMSTTISGLLMVAPNLLLNALMWLACPTSAEDEDVR